MQSSFGVAVASACDASRACSTAASASHPVLEREAGLPKFSVSHGMIRAATRGRPASSPSSRDNSAAWRARASRRKAWGSRASRASNHRGFRRAGLRAGSVVPKGTILLLSLRRCATSWASVTERRNEKMWALSPAQSSCVMQRRSSLQLRPPHCVASIGSSTARTTSFRRPTPRPADGPDCSHRPGELSTSRRSFPNSCSR